MPTPTDPDGDSHPDGITDPDGVADPGEDPVLVDFRKYPDLPHWQFDMHRLGEDEHGMWLWAPAGTPLSKPGESRTSGTGFVKVIVPDSRWTAIFGWEPRRVRCFVDIITPPVWNRDRVTMVDMDLDVAIGLDGNVWVEDEDEFAEHRVKYGYPERLIDQTRLATARVVTMIESGAEPFATVAQTWLQRAFG